MQNSKFSLLKQRLAVLLVSGILGVSNILRNESKFAIDFKAKNAIIKIEENKPAPISHPNLLWKPEFYIKELFEKLNNRFKLN